MYLDELQDRRAVSFPKSYACRSGYLLSASQVRPKLAEAGEWKLQARGLSGGLVAVRWLVWAARPFQTNGPTARW